MCWVGRDPQGSPSPTPKQCSCLIPPAHPWQVLGSKGKVTETQSNPCHKWGLTDRTLLLGMTLFEGESGRNSVRVKELPESSRAGALWGAPRAHTYFWEVDAMSAAAAACWASNSSRCSTSLEPMKPSLASCRATSSLCGRKRDVVRDQVQRWTSAAPTDNLSCRDTALLCTQMNHLPAGPHTTLQIFLQAEKGSWALP